MGKYSSDSDDHRRYRHKSSRKRDRRSRSRERRKRSRSRERRRSRSSSYEDRRESYRSRRDRRYSRSSSSSSRSSSDDSRRKSRKYKKASSSGTSSQVTKERAKEKMKRALAKAESKDVVLKRDKAKKELDQLAPDKDTILQIESNEFVPQSFSSSAGSKGQQSDGKNTSNSHEDAMFGPRGLESTPIPSMSEGKIPLKPVLPPAMEKESLFASWLHEDEETKTARWITKLKKMRQELLAAT